MTSKVTSISDKFTTADQILSLKGVLSSKTRPFYSKRAFEGDMSKYLFMYVKTSVHDHYQWQLCELVCSIYVNYILSTRFLLSSDTQQSGTVDKISDTYHVFFIDTSIKS